MSLPLRLRVAGAFGAATALLLVVLGWVVYAGVERSLVDQAKDGLQGRLDSLTSTPASQRPETLRSLDRDYVGQVVGPGGEVVASSPSARTPLVVVPAPDGFSERRVRLAGTAEPEDLLLLSRRTGGDTLVVGTSREDVSDALQQVLVVASTAGVVGLGVALLLGYAVAGVALRPVEAMRRRAESVSAEHSDERLPVPPGRDELHRLGRTLNDMLDRLDEGLRRERRFVAEAGHELRTPLALLRTEIDLAVSGDRSYDDLLAALRSSGDEVDRLIELAESLLMLSTGGAEREIVDLTTVLHETVARFEPRASGRGLVVDARAGLVAACDRTAVGRALANLVDNALRHGSGEVTVGGARDDDAVVVSVVDGGVLDPEVAGSAHYPFVRSGASRAGGGAGLGLAIAAEVMTQHGGTLTLRSRPAGGTEAVLRLPAAATSAAPSSAPGSGAPR